MGKPGDIRIDRATKWGNPFAIGKDGDRDDVCNKYTIWLERQLQSGTLNLHELKNAKRLGCWCKPLRCHGDYLKQKIESMDIRNLNNFGVEQMTGYKVNYMKYISRYDVQAYTKCNICIWRQRFA